MNLQNLLNDRLKDRACLNCGRRLTDPQSIKDKVGPVCRHRVMMKYARIQASFVWGVDEDEYLERADAALTKMPELDYVIVGNTPMYHSLLAIRDEHGDAMPVTWVDGRDKIEELNPEAMSWIDAVKETFNTETLHECIHIDDEVLGILDTYWGPCNDVKKHQDAPSDNESWGQHYSYAFWQLLDSATPEWCDGMEWYEVVTDIIDKRKKQGKEFDLLDFVLDYLVNKEVEEAVCMWGKYPLEALEVAVGWGEEFHHPRNILIPN